MLDLDRLLGRLLGGGSTGLAGGLLGLGATGLLGSRRGRKLGGKALKVGGIAALGALAYHAWTRYQASQAPGRQPGPSTGPPAAPPPGSGFLPAPADAQASRSLGVTLIRAMIAAAHADGEMDAAESRRVLGQLKELDLTAEEKAFLLDELARPADLDALAREARTPEIAAEVYAASLLAVDVGDPAESAYLERLAARLGLAPALVAELHRTVEASARDASQAAG